MEDFEVISTGVNAQPTETEGKATPKPASANADETQEESGTPAENDNAEGEESQEEGQEADEGESQDGDKRQPKKNGFKKRIDKLNSKISEKDREIEHWKNEAMKASGKQDNQQKDTPAKSDNGKPNPENFDTNAEYIDALTDWKMEQAENKKAAKAQEDQVKTESQKRAADFQAKLVDFKKEHADFDDVLEDVRDVQLNHAQQEAIFTSEVAPAVMYELAKDSERLEKFQKMNFAEACREVGRIESRLERAKESSEAKPIKKTTSAPAPMKPVGSTSKTEKSLEDMSFDEFMEARNAKSRGRR